MTRAFTGIFMLALTVSACTPSPDRVCDHIRELEARGGRRDEATLTRHRAGCVQTMTAVRARNSDAYKTAARCVMNANDEPASDACIMPLLGFMDH